METFMCRWALFTLCFPKNQGSQHTRCCSLLRDWLLRTHTSLPSNHNWVVWTEHSLVNPLICCLSEHRANEITLREATVENARQWNSWPWHKRHVRQTRHHWPRPGIVRIRRNYAFGSLKSLSEGVTGFMLCSSCHCHALCTASRVNSQIPSAPRIT